jgi:two-component system sensor histidine kinase YesM
MKFQVKMRIVYVILGMLAAIVAGSIYYYVNVGKINEREMQNLSISAQQLNQQYDEIIKSMEAISYYLLSDADTLTSITSISNMVRTENTKNYFLDAENMIRAQENNDYISKRFYRVIFCNDNCKPIANNDIIREDVNYKDMPWYEKAENNPDTFTIIGVHEDTWGEKEDVQVLSVIKQIQGKNMGYIEVQQDLERLQEKLLTADPELKLCLIDDDGEVIYGNEDADTEFCKSLSGRGDIPAGKFTGSDMSNYLAAGVYNQDAKTTIMVYKDSSVIKKDMSYVMYMSVFLVGGIMLFSILYVTISTRRLTKPMVELQKVLENTSLETLDQSVHLELGKENDEFGRMGQVYEDMRSRLRKAILREKQLSTLQLQAQFDMLQVQVNPHFIYNVLNVISSRGIVNDDEVICDMCDDLAGMLRYSTDTKEKYATVRSEITYLELYFSLLKYRYEYKLEYEIDVDASVELQVMPKLVIQQLVENSINHGYTSSSRIMKIAVAVYRDESCWYIRVRDNGDGFAGEIQRRLERDLKRLKEDLMDNRQNVEMKIGGMGILNTFARLYLLNGENLKFVIRNQEEGGAEIIIGTPLK